MPLARRLPRGDRRSVSSARVVFPRNTAVSRPFAERLALYLVERGWDVTVYCQLAGQGSIHEDLWQGRAPGC